VSIVQYSKTREHNALETGSVSILRRGRRHLLLEKSKLVQHAYEEGHRVGWDEARFLEIESYSRYRKYEESVHMACLTMPTRSGHFSHPDSPYQQ
jgi:hypothetical protein